MLLFHLHTLHANALWKVPSQFPPSGTEGGRGWARVEGSIQAVSASPRGKPPAPSRCPQGPDQHQRRRGPRPAPAETAGCSGLHALESSFARCALLQPPPRKFWSGARSPGFLSVLSTALRGNPETSIGCPMSQLAFQVCTGLNFGQNLNVSLTKNK